MKLTVFYDDQFWVGVVEAEENGRLKAARWIFGSSEPSDTEVYALVQRVLWRLLDDVGATIAAEQVSLRRINPKRSAREAGREIARQGVSTRAQEAMKLEMEQRKAERRTVTRAEREAEAARKRAIREAKAKAKHRGR